MGISTGSRSAWRKRHGEPAAMARDDDQDAEGRRLKRELQRELIRHKVHRMRDAAREDVFD